MYYIIILEVWCNQLTYIVIDLDNHKPALPYITYAKTLNKKEDDDDDDDDEGYPRRHPNCAVLKQKFYLSVLANMSSGDQGVLHPNPNLIATRRPAT